MTAQDQPGMTCRVFTASRRRPDEIGRLPGLSLPWTFTVGQVALGVGGLLLVVTAVSAGASPWIIPPVAVITLVLGRMLRRVKIDDRRLGPGVAGRARWLSQRNRRRRLLKRTADVVVDNLVVGADHSIWAVFALRSAPYGALSGTDAAVGSIRRVARLVRSIAATEWRITSTVLPTTLDTVADRMSAAATTPTWQREINAETARLGGVYLAERHFWLWVRYGEVTPPATAVTAQLRRIAALKGVARARWLDIAAHAEQTAALVARAAHAIPLRPATTPEITELLRRVPIGPADVPTPTDEEDHDVLYPDPAAAAAHVGSPFIGAVEGASAWRLGDAEWGEPLPQITVASTDTGDTIAHIAAVVSELPAAWVVPGGGELLWRIDRLAGPWEWVVDVTVTPHSVATAKTRNQARRLAWQYGEYSGDASGAPPELDQAMQQIQTQRDALAASGGGDEYNVAIAMSTSTRIPADQPELGFEILTEHLEKLRGMAAAVGVRVVVPVGDQRSARKLWLPTRTRYLPLVKDYRQYMLADGLAGLGPVLQSELGDPQGAVLGANDDRGYNQIVLFDPTLAPRAQSVGGDPRSPSVGISGRLGSGKSVFSKRLAWTALAAGGTAVVVDRSNHDTAEYVTYAKAVAAIAPEIAVEIVDVTSPASRSLDPMRTIADPQIAANAAVRLLSYTAGLDPRSAVAARLQTRANASHGTPLLHLVREAAANPGPTDPAEWVALQSLAEVLAEDPVGGSLFDPNRQPANLVADFVVLHVPGLVLAENPDTPADVAAAAVVLGTMLVARALTHTATRFSGLLLDEAWSLLPDARARAVVIEALRDGRKHNAAVWLATQSPSDFAITTELSELIGQMALFGVDKLSAAVTAAKLAGLDPDLTAPALMELPTGTCLWRDVVGRVGLVEVWLPADPTARIAIETTPESVVALG